MGGDVGGVGKTGGLGGIWGGVGGAGGLGGEEGIVENTGGAGGFGFSIFWGSIGLCFLKAKR